MKHSLAYPTCTLKDEPCRFCSHETIVIPYTKLEEDPRTHRLKPTTRGDDTVQLGSYCNNINKWVEKLTICPKDEDTMKGEVLEKAQREWEERMKKGAVKRKRGVEKKSLVEKVPVKKPLIKKAIVKKEKVPAKEEKAKKPVIKKAVKKPIVKKPIKKPVVKKPIIKKAVEKPKVGKVVKKPVVKKITKPKKVNKEIIYI